MWAPSRKNESASFDKTTADKRRSQSGSLQNLETSMQLF